MNLKNNELSYDNFSKYKISELIDLQRKYPEDFSRNIFLNEVIEKSAKFSKYKFWESFDPELISNEEFQYKTNPLLNIPFGAKDIFNSFDFNTKMGSSNWKHHFAGNNARVIDNCLNKGAILVGKTVTSEYAVHALNKTKNFYDHLLTPGTSSSGSAVAVASKTIPFSLGSQSAGSIIRPASFNGVFALKPSFGTLPRTGVLKTADTLDQIGLFTIHFEDLSYIFHSIRLRGKNYPFIHKFIDNRNNTFDKSKTTIYYFDDPIFQNAESYVRQSFENFIKIFPKVMPLNYKKLKEIPVLHSKIYHKSLSLNLQNYIKPHEELSPSLEKIMNQAKLINNQDFLKSLTKQSDLIKEFNSFFTVNDFFLCPSTTSVAPKRDLEEKEDYCKILNFLHLPAINVPIFSHKNNPYGLQLSSIKYNDNNLLNFAKFIQNLY